MKRRNPNLTVIATKYSQSTPTNNSSYQQQEDPPYSPAASSTSSFLSSISGIAEKSASELGSLLKNTYKLLKEKEKNLYMAAELGKGLLEHNQVLRADYDKLLENIRNCQTEKESYDNDMRFISSNKRTYDHVIESLERKNAEIEAVLEQTQKQAESTNQTHLQRQRKLESEIEILKDNLDMAAAQVQELEEERHVQQTRRKQLDDRKRLEKQRIEDEELLEQLTNQLQDLYVDNKHLQASKKLVEEKLIHSLHDLDMLRKDFENFNLTQESYLALQEAFEKQRIHIQELNDSLEEHRLVLSRLRDKALLSHYSDDTVPSLSTNGDPSVFSAGTLKQNLMGELEDAWAKNQENLKSNYNHHHHHASLFSTNRLCDLAHLTERNVTSFCNAPADYALEKFLSSIGIDNRSILDEAERFFKSSSSSSSNYNVDDLFEPQNDDVDFAENNLYPTYFSTAATTTTTTTDTEKEQPKKGLLNLILFQIRYLIRSLLRWCRYAIILATALFINLWKGPDLISLKN
ncbi:uncharacterized protein BX663DRAFT_440091 [Cokeromyces recurvatus]|uniref:uncharacterized protein n=1 Tax=Cokeromyces recurvatus TaxID=90255 RepID=UPI00221E9422|nr:uncharacterized protein BX663DRAFT_440091 [Cokeromyces recurvatus]KAI7900026.1 hypothetical protein BX663DRAFT_440091 [Cokeromyces recurvatus]